MLHLRFANLGLRSIPDLTVLPLETLELQGNHLDSLENLPMTLKTLNVYNNSFVNDGIFFPFPRLEHLNIGHNRINIYEEDDFVVCFPSLLSLDFTQNYLKQVGFLRDSHLEILHVSHNRLQVLAGLPLTLKQLIADWNEITMVQSRLPPSLECIDLCYNSLRYAGLPLNWPLSLRELHLDKNDIERFPRKLPSSLEILTLCGNRLTEIPTELPASLSCLILSSNRIRHLPDYTKHKRFSIFLINNNCLTKIPTHFNAIVSAFDKNWQDTIHHSAQQKIKKCWKRYVIPFRLRHLLRTKKIRDELFMVSMMPERWQQVDTLDPVWYRKHS
jgi:Leucine-rich repeat (LRR) protein